MLLGDGNTFQATDSDDAKLIFREEMFCFFFFSPWLYKR